MKIFKTLFLSLSLFFSQLGNAEQNGIDEPGIAKFPTVAYKAHPKGFALGAFSNTFGDARPSLEKMLSRGDIPLFKINLSWKDNHSFSRKDFPAIVAEAKRFSQLFINNPIPACYFNGATEHNLSEQDAKDLAQQVLAVIPSRCQYVNNPLHGRGKLIPTNDRIINEVHGKDPRPSGRFGYSFDGTSSVDSNVTEVKQIMKGAEYFLVWHPANNGRLKADDPTPRPQRKAYATTELLESLAALMKDKGATNLNPKWIYKSHADRHKTPPESRAYKPVIIERFKTKYSRITIGKTSCPNGGTYDETINGKKVWIGYRYYCPKFGYEMQNSPVPIKADGRKIGVINPAFRDGGFR